MGRVSVRQRQELFFFPVPHSSTFAGEAAGDGPGLGNRILAWARAVSRFATRAERSGCRWFIAVFLVMEIEKRKFHFTAILAKISGGFEQGLGSCFVSWRKGDVLWTRAIRAFV